MLISFISGIPLVAWIFFGGTGRLGDYALTEGYRTVTIVIAVLTGIWYFVVTPFLIWPRIFNGSGSESRDYILKKGAPARAVLLSLGLRGLGDIRWKGRRNTYQVMSLKVTLEGEEYTIDGHLELVPESVVPFLRRGMEFPMKVSRSDRMKIAIDWEPLLPHFPGSAEGNPEGAT